VSDRLAADAPAVTKDVSDVGPEDMILDIGPRSAAQYAGLIATSGTILWNGPVGVFEHAQFAAGTRAIAEAVAASSAFSVAGGGDTLAALEAFGVGDRISYVSTGGGAFLEYVEGRTLPAVAVLEARASAAEESR
jgi:phosphoglycerate kinase